MIDISVIVVNWNAGETLSLSLDSIIHASKDHRMEIIVIDNASTDGSFDKARRASPCLQYIQNTINLGFSKANNIGIKKSKGKYICLINPDVIVPPGTLDRMTEYMDQHPSVGILGPKVLNADFSVQLTCRKFPSLWNNFCRAMALDTLLPWVFADPLMRSWAHNSTIKVDVLSGCFLMIRREALNQVGLLDESFFIYSEDVDYCKRCWARKWEVVYLAEVVAMHYGGVCSSHFPVRFSVEMLKANLQYWRKHHSRSAELAFRLISLLHLARKVGQAGAFYLLRQSGKNSVNLKANIVCLAWLLGITNLPRIKLLAGMAN